MLLQLLLLITITNIIAIIPATIAIAVLLLYELLRSKGALLASSCLGRSADCPEEARDGSEEAERLKAAWPPEPLLSYCHVIVLP